MLNRVKELEEQSLAKLFMTAEDNKRHIALLVDMVCTYLGETGMPSLISVSGRNVDEVNNSQRRIFAGFGLFVRY